MKTQIFAFPLFVFGLAVLAAALAPSLLTEGALLLLVGACSVTFLALGNSTLQLQADPAMRGRVMSLWSVAFLGSTPIGGPLVGFIGGDLGARYGLAIGGLAALTAALYGWIALKPRPARTPIEEGVGSPALATAGSRAE